MDRAGSGLMRFSVNAVVFLCVTVLMTRVTVRAQSTPPVNTSSQAQPSAADLMTEIHLLRQQMEQQQQRHDAELNALQAQIDALKQKGAPSATAPPTSAPAIPSSAAAG